MEHHKSVVVLNRLPSDTYLLYGNSIFSFRAKILLGKAFLRKLIGSILKNVRLSLKIGKLSPSPNRAV